MQACSIPRDRLRRRWMRIFSATSRWRRPLAKSPSLLQDDLTAFWREAERAFPDISETWLVVIDAGGQQVLNLLSPRGEALPRRSLGLYSFSRSCPESALKLRLQTTIV